MIPASGSLRVWALIAITAIYIVGGELGLALAFPQASAAALWPATGISLAAFLLLGPRAWPAVFAGAFLVNVTATGALVMALGIALGSTLEGYVGAWLVRRFASGERVFERASDIFRFALLAGFVGTIPSATLGAISLASGGYATWERVGTVWLTWWLGDAAGALVVTPLLVLWCRTPIARPTRGRLIEGLALAGGIVLTGLVVFNGLFSPGWNQPLALLCVPPLVWMAYRFGPRETAAAVAVLSGVATWGTVRGLGPFVQGVDPHASLLQLQTFMGVVALSLPFAVVVTARRQAEAASAHLAAIVTSSDDAILSTTLDGIITSWNPAAERLYGYTAAMAIGQPITLVAAPGRGEPSPMLDPARAPHRVHRYETVRLRKDGVPVDVALTVSPILDRQGAAMGASDIARDVTARKALDAIAHERDTLHVVASLAIAAAHEINNPLAIVMAQTELLASEARTARQRRHIELSLAAIERIRAILARMGRITRLEHVDPSPNLPDMLDLGRSSAPEDAAPSPAAPR